VAPEKAQCQSESKPTPVTFTARITCRDRDVLLRWARCIYGTAGDVTLAEACELLAATMMAPESLVGDDLSMVDARLLAVRVK